MTKETKETKPKSAQQELWELLKTDEQKQTVANALRNLKKQVQEDICYGLIAFLKLGMHRQFPDEWVQQQYNGLVKQLGN